MVPVLSPKRIVSKVTAFDGEHLVILGRRDFSQAIRPSQIEAMEVMAGKRRWATGAIGFVVGAVIGGVAYKSHADAKYEDDIYNEGLAWAVAAPVSGLIGALIGAVIGRPRWVSVQLISAPNPQLKSGLRLGIGFSNRRR
mgnify:CR=1 FL=1